MIFAWKHHFDENGHLVRAFFIRKHYPDGALGTYVQGPVSQMHKNQSVDGNFLNELLRKHMMLKGTIQNTRAVKELTEAVVSPCQMSFSPNPDENCSPSTSAFPVTPIITGPHDVFPGHFFLLQDLRVPPSWHFSS